MKLQLGNCDAGCSDGEASNKAPQENDDPDSSFYERGVSFSSLRQAAQFDVPANKRFLEAATQRAVTQRQRNMSSVWRLYSSARRQWGLHEPSKRVAGIADSRNANSILDDTECRCFTSCFIRVGVGGLEPRARYTESVFLRV